MHCWRLDRVSLVQNSILNKYYMHVSHQSYGAPFATVLNKFQDPEAVWSQPRRISHGHLKQRSRLLLHTQVLIVKLEGQIIWLLSKCNQLDGSGRWIYIMSFIATAVVDYNYFKRKISVCLLPRMKVFEAFLQHFRHCKEQTWKRIRCMNRVLEHSGSLLPVDLHRFSSLYAGIITDSETVAGSEIDGNRSLARLASSQK